MHPAIAEAETPGETCIVTALWDWSPVASWDSGKHWPSWQTPDDGTSMGYFGEGGGCFGVGQSKHVLCMHHHDVGYSSRCGKNMSRLIIPNGASAAGPTFERKQGSRSEPNGMIYALMSMGTPQFQTLTDKAVTCDGVNGRGDLGVSTSYQCLSMIDIGMVYNWYSGANVAVWRGDTDKHCHLCKLSGSQPSWNMTDTKGAIVFAFDKDAKVQKPRFNKVKEDNNGEYSYDGKGSDDHRAMYKFNKHVAKEARLEMGQEEEAPPFSTDLVPLGGNPFWLLKSFNFGANFTWILLPEFLQTLSKTSVDPTNSSTLYGIAGSCIGRSYDGAETWGDEKCWQATGLVGHFTDLVIKDSQTMLAMRSGQVPLRTVDGGKTWTPLNSLSAIAARTLHAAFSWSGKTLAVSTVIDQTVIWISTDDGDTWVDESGDYSAMSGGIAQWYNSTLYICSMGQGISSKVFEEKP